MHKDQTAGVAGFVRGGFRHSAQSCRKIGVYLSTGVFPCFVQIPVLYISGDEVGPSSSFLYVIFIILRLEYEIFLARDRAAFL